MHGTHLPFSRRSGRGGLEVSVSVGTQEFGGGALTARNHHPDEVDEEEVKPKVIRLRPGVADVLIVQIKQAGGIVEDQAVYLADRDDGLNWEAVRVLHGDHVGSDIGERSPADLL